MNTMLKKVALATSVIMLSMTSANAAADNTIEISGDVSASIVVGFSDVSAAAANAGLFDGTAATIALGTVAAGADFADSVQNVFVKTNSATGASITLTDGSANAGALMNGANTIPVTYTVGATPYVVGTTGAVALNAGVDAGSVAVTTFTINPDVTSAVQVAGTYSTTLTVVIAAN